MAGGLFVGGGTVAMTVRSQVCVTDVADVAGQPEACVPQM
jgi:hypothetical protein